MFAYVVSYRCDTDDTKEQHMAIVLAKDQNEARNKVNAFNVNEEKKSCIYIYSVELMDENRVFDMFIDDIAYDTVRSVTDMW